MPLVEEEQLHTIPEVARRYRVNEATVRSMIRDGRLEAIRFGKQLRISEGALQRFIAESPVR
jgi:excisionase family DNA binding protein